MKTNQKTHEEEMKELREAPEINLEQVRTNINKLNQGVKNISEKISEIGESAIKQKQATKKITTTKTKSYFL